MSMLDVINHYSMWSCLLFFLVNCDTYIVSCLLVGEPGLMISKIKRDFEFDGYKGNRELSDKKIVKNVFKDGDRYFNTGDLITTDKDYFLYFSDRIGDTFRLAYHI